MINDKVALVKVSPYPENVYYFFLCTDVRDVPQEDLDYFFSLAAESVSYFGRFRDLDLTSNKAEKKLREICAELYFRLVSEHVPDLPEVVALIFHDKPKWEGLDLLWEVTDDSVKETLNTNLSGLSGHGDVQSVPLPEPEQSRAEDTEDKRSEAVTNILLAHLARESGHLLTCEQRLRDAINLLTDLDDRDSLMIKAKALQLLANSLSEVRLFDEAEQLYLEAKELYEKLNLVEKISFVLHGLGNLYTYKEQLNEAISYFRKSLSAKESLSSSTEDILPTLYGLALCYIKTESFEEALVVIHKYEARLEGKTDQRLAELWANFFGYQNDWTRVVEILTAILSASREEPSSRTHLMTELSLAHAYNQLNEYEIAEKHFWNAFYSMTEYLHKWLSPQMREGLRRSLLAGIEQQFQVWRKRAECDKTMNYKILNVVEKLSAVDLQSKFGIEQTVAISDSTLKTLSEGELLIYLFGTDLALYTLFLDNDGIVLADSAPYGEYAQFDSLSSYDYFSSDVGEPNEDFEDCFNTVVGTAFLLFQVQKEVNKICLLFPFGKGNNIPWDFFIANVHTFSKELRPQIFKTTPISRLPSFSVYKTIKDCTLQEGAGPPAVFLDPVGPFTPLWGTRDQAAVIKRFFPEARIFAGRMASSSNLQNVIRPSFLHISCHSRFEPLQPLESFLMLSTNDLSARDERAWREWQEGLRFFLLQHLSTKAKESDYGQGKPTPYEGSFQADLFRMLRLRGTEFVFLAACSAAKVADYDEIQGFAQCVFLAGCPNLIAPLYPVDVRATLAFVEEFYKEYRNLTDLDVLQAGKIGKCVVLAKNALIRKGFSNREAAAWTIFGLG